MKTHKEKTIDHKVPLGRGGQHVYGNLAVCCEKCNILKGNMTDAEYLEYLKSRPVEDGKEKNQEPAATP